MKLTHTIIFTFVVIATTLTLNAADNNPAAVPAAPNLSPGPEYADSARMFQGVAGIERGANGRLWATWYSGSVTENEHNYILLYTSGDDGASWHQVLVLDPDRAGPVRAFDPCLWLDPAGKLWLFWTQEKTQPKGRDTGSFVTFAITTMDSGQAGAQWSAPQKIAQGVMMNKPTLTKDGRWLLPISTWTAETSARVVLSTDQGMTFSELGAARIPDRKSRNADEHMLVERKDGSLWMLVRGKFPPVKTDYNGLGESVSTDGGKTWSDVTASPILHPGTRFFVRKLASGRLLLVRNDPPDGKKDRSHLTAFLSDDDGHTWKGGLVLDERMRVSYPDGTQAPDGSVYVIYDHERGGPNSAKEILMAVFTEADISEGKLTSPAGRLRVRVNQATGINPAVKPNLELNPNTNGIALLTAAPDELADGFARPPDSAKAHTWWHWMNGNITKEGITADLEAMARVGIGGAQIFTASEGIPTGPVPFNGPEWRALVKHAAQEADRLGIELCIHNCAGWSSSGGPWNTPEYGMQVVVSSEQRVTGPVRFAGVLAQPPTKLDFYRDIAVLAFRTPAGETVQMKDFSPQVTTSTGKAEGVKLFDDIKNTAVVLPSPQPGKPQFVRFEFAQPYTAQLLTILPGVGRQGCAGMIEVSDDGKQFREIKSFLLPRGGEEKQTFAFDPVTARFWRVLFTSANARTKYLTLAEVNFSPRSGIEKLAAKTFMERGGELRPETKASATVEAVACAQIVDLTGRLGADGKLTWDAPAGAWTILRLGYTPNGVNNHPAPKDATGLECDKLNREAVAAHWAGMMGPLIKELGSLAGTTLNNVLIDSYEVGTQNWTPKFREEFQKRRGYDLLPFLPALTGRVVESPEVSERFLWDFRRTIADLFAENYSGVFAELAHQNGMLFSIEPYGNCPSDDLQYGSYGDIPMTEFWPGSGNGGRQASSVAHVQGRKFVGAEAFTAVPEQGKWLKDPFSLKASGDANWCAGVNRFIFHRYAMQPWTQPGRNPGMTMGQWGTHFERTTTWWEQSRAWLQYIARSQFMLQQGLFVADACVFSGDGAPNSVRNASLPAGYDFDGICAADLKLLTVKNGRLVLPDGMNYRMLALPPATTMTPATLRKIKELADAGALIVGPKPTRSPSLGNYPKCDEEIKQLAAAAKIISDQTPAQVVAALNLPPDFEVLGNPQPTGKTAYIHRVVQGTDLYFVSNQQEQNATRECAFRIRGKTPELWHPDTGRIEPAPVWREENGRTIVLLEFEPAGSVFVVFRQPAAADHLVAAQFTSTAPVVQAAPVEITILKAEYGMFNVPATDCVDVTDAVRKLVAAGQRRIVAGNQLGGDPAGGTPKELRIEYRAPAPQTVTVAEGRTVELPAGAEITRAVYGVLPDVLAADKIVDITARIAAQVKAGRLSVKVGRDLAGADPAPMTLKQLLVKYRRQGVEKTVRVGENKLLELPEDEPSTAPPAYALTVNAAGLPVFCAWQPGRIAMKTAAGKTLKAEVHNLPPALELNGDWQVNFPPNLGAPVTVNLPQLISWPQHADNGVKYFSGTATYVREVELPATLFGPGRSLWLNLGVVQNLAEVSVNGKPLGILWKPPFRTDITAVAKPGKNKLEIKVTNLWPNRLIGDEQLPEDCEWSGSMLKAWPQWLLDGKPSPTGRLTFTTWHHWKKDDALLPSGLLGPVTINAAQMLTVQ